MEGDHCTSKGTSFFFVASSLTLVHEEMGIVADSHIAGRSHGSMVVLSLDSDRFSDCTSVE